MPGQRGVVYVPPQVPEGQIDVAFDADTIDRGAREIQESLEAVGRHIPWEEAQAQARAMLAETLPTVR